MNAFSGDILGLQDNLPIAEAKDLQPAQLFELIKDPNRAVLMTYNVEEGNVFSGHVVVLGAYDPNKGFGFINSGADRPSLKEIGENGDELTWKTIEEMRDLLADPVALETAEFSPNFVIISRP